jgi:DNA transformation protein and related proteins
MAVSAATRAYVEELFEDLGGVTARAMMGGLALYSHGRIFGLVSSDGRVFLKASGALAEALAAEGAEQFSYARAGAGTTRMGYWSLPDAALDDPEVACGWARRVLAFHDPGPS